MPIVIVADASVVLLGLVGDGAAGDRARALLRSEATVPEVVDIEVVSALRGMLRGHKVGGSRAEQAVTDLVTLPLQRVPHAPLLQRVWQLRSNLSAYDATYVALAEHLGALLVTTDTRIGKAPGLRCEVQLLL